MGVKWMNAAAAATSYPTVDGRGGVTATSGSSAFADGKQWDNKECILMELVIIPAISVTTTCVVTSHDGSSDVLPTFTLVTGATGTAPVSIDLHGIAIRGLKVVMSGAGSVALLKYEVGGDATYTAT